MIFSWSSITVDLEKSHNNTNKQTNKQKTINCEASGYLIRPTRIRAGRGIETNGRLEAESLPASVRTPPGRQAASLSPLSNTRPQGLV